MIDTVSKGACTGCKMCGDLCPKHAIYFESDEEGFWFPKVDEAKCVRCGLCLKKCPSCSLPDKRNKEFIPISYGSLSKDENLRWNSSSGGLFSEAASRWMTDGGLCVGAIYDKNQNVKHVLCSKIEDIQALRQSKYVQSETNGIYSLVNNALIQGQRVLVCGTPCQVAAFYSFLGKDYDNLCTIDFVCLGIPSPLVYRRYLEMLEKRYKSKVKKVWFKNKKEGWRGIGTSIQFENNKEYFRTGSRDLYINAFGEGLDMRRSCHACQYREIPHRSDIMLGDFWGIENLHAQLDDNKGMSAIIINSFKGLKLFESIADHLSYFPTTVDEIAKENYAIYKPKVANKNRDAFLRELNHLSLDKAMEKYSFYSGKVRLRIEAGYYWHQLKNKCHFERKGK